VGQCFRTHAVAAVDDPGDSRGADACFSGYFG
jgi:hypothetical protein